MARASVASDEEDDVREIKGSTSKAVDEDDPQTSGEEGEGEEEYEIEQIIDAKHGAFAGGKIGYLVKWKNYSEEHNSWINEDDAGNAQELIDQYWEERKKQKRAKAGTKPKAAQRRSTATEDSLSVPKKRGRKSKKDDSDVEMDSDEEKPKKNARKSNGKLKGGRGTSALSDDGEVGNMDAYLDVQSWEELVKRIDTIERNEDGQLLVYFTLNDPKNSRIKEPSETCRTRFPQKMLDFYESNLRWRQNSEHE